MTDAVASSVIFTRDQVDDIVQHCRNDYPNEACGLLSGKGNEIKRVFRMTNVEHSPVVYVMDPKEQLKIFDEIDRDGQELIAIYHSHTHSQAYPSATDIRMAYYPESVYVIVSLADIENPVSRAFRIVDGQVREIEVVVR